MTDPAAAAALHLAALVESSDDAIISKDLNGIVISWNPAAERIFGFTAAEMIGKSITVVIPTERLNEETEVLSKIRRGELVDHFETIRRRKDGTQIPISLTVSPIRTADGTIVGASKIARDISDRRRAEQALALAEARQNELRERLIALVEGSGALFASPRLQDVLPAVIALAQSLSRADGYAIWRLSAIDGIWEIGASFGVSEEFTHKLVELYRGGIPFANSLAVTDVSSHPLLQDRADIYRAEGIVSLLATPLSIAGVRAGTFVTYYHSPRSFDAVDIETAQAIGNLGAAAITTAQLYEEQRRSREEATKAYLQANEASRAKDEFLATLSHELRTPLNAVLGWTRMLRAGVVPPVRMARAIEVIERNADAQLRLVEDMLDLSRIITGNLRLNVQPTHLASAIEAAVETLVPATNAKEIVVKVDIDPLDLVMGDAARLQQVVWNLISNAVKFTPKRGRITVSVRRVTSESAVEMEIADTGEGIDAEVLPYVFDRFRQGNSGPMRTHMGLGLGLAIVKHIVEMHGGRVSVHSEGKGKGAVIRLTLPAATPAQQLAVSNGTVGAVRPGDRESSNDHSLLAGVRALVVDDDPEARELLTALLQAWGILVRSVASVREGLAALERELPDIILSDLAMPDEDGYDLIRSVRQRPADSGGLLPAIAVTAYARPEDETRSLSSGYQIHLTKPIDPAELFSAVERLTPERARPVE
jgi:PAS domain S-box-containing protein